jgi:hypothetical protein
METKKDALVAAQSLLRVQGLQVATLNQAVPNAPILEKQIRQLEGIAKRNQVAIIGISIAEVDLTGSGLVKVDEELVPPYQDSAFFKISVTVEGSYSTTSSFLRDVERMRRPISPIGVTFSEGSREDGNLNLNIIGLVPYLQK